MGSLGNGVTFERGRFVSFNHLGDKMKIEVIKICLVLVDISVTALNVVGAKKVGSLQERPCREIEEGGGG